jgi:hypothetical protein
MKALFKNLIVALFFLLQGCATQAGYQRVVETWLGDDINNLIQSWGPPSDVFRLPNNDMMYTWFFDGGTVAVPIGNAAYAVRKSCKTTFTVNSQGIVQNYRFEGNSCKQ